VVDVAVATTVCVRQAAKDRPSLLGVEWRFFPPEPLKPGGRAVLGGSGASTTVPMKRVEPKLPVAPSVVSADVAALIHRSRVARGLETEAEAPGPSRPESTTAAVSLEELPTHQLLATIEREVRRHCPAAAVYQSTRRAAWGSRAVSDGRACWCCRRCISPLTARPLLSTRDVAMTCMVPRLLCAAGRDGGSGCGPACRRASASGCRRRHRPQGGEGRPPHRCCWRVTSSRRDLRP
jgi:hypothetical protein